MECIINKGKKKSGCYNLNLLCNDGNAYVMDNHLAAIWCWLQKININKKYNLFHIDKHYDLLDSQLDCWVEELSKQNIDLENIDIHELTKLRYMPKTRIDNKDNQLFRWDNYLPIFDNIYPKILHSSYFATQKCGTKPQKKLITDEVDIWELPQIIGERIEENSFKWIINLDIDYFFLENENGYFQFVTDDYILGIAEEIKKKMAKIEVITIALSPECCGGWQNSERIARLIGSQLEYDFGLNK